MAVAVYGGRDSRSPGVEVQLPHVVQQVEGTAGGKFDTFGLRKSCSHAPLSTLPRTAMTGAFGDDAERQGVLLKGEKRTTAGLQRECYTQIVPKTFVRPPSRRKQLTLFARNFIRHPKMLGSLIPSSRFLIGRLLHQVDWDQALVIVEYGPGVGSFTGEILRLMRQDATLIAVETNREFVDFLKRSFPDRRLRVVHGSAADVEKVLAEGGLRKADYVVSGIPLSTIGDRMRQEILLSTHRVLHPGGALLVYQFSPKALPDLQRIYSRVTRSFEPLNVLPAQVFHCAK